MRRKITHTLIWSRSGDKGRKTSSFGKVDDASSTGMVAIAASSDKTDAVASAFPGKVGNLNATSTETGTLKNVENIKYIIIYISMKLEKKNRELTLAIF